MLDGPLDAAIEYVRRNTAFPGWAVEFLLFFVGWTLARFGAAMRDSVTLPEVSLTLWASFWAAYDNLRAYADDSAIAALIVTIIMEVIVMVLARKLLRINREEGREEGFAEGVERGRAEVRAELEPIIKELQERVRRLENGGTPAASEPSQ